MVFTRGISETSGFRIFIVIVYFFRIRRELNDSAIADSSPSIIDTSLGLILYSSFKMGETTLI